MPRNYKYLYGTCNQEISHNRKIFKLQYNVNLVYLDIFSESFVNVYLKIIFFFRCVVFLRKCMKTIQIVVFNFVKKSFESFSDFMIQVDSKIVSLSQWSPECTNY